MNKPSIPKGTRDFSPVEMAKRNYIFDTIRQVYALYGFQQIETPAMETLQTLMGKYGEEGDKLLFKVLNSGDYMNKITDDELKERNSLHLAAKLCEKGLRYALTVPFARFVVMHRDELQFPFKRFQIQPVWRADRPQKGRYREFYQCDADVVGSDSLINEVELIEMIDMVFSRLGVRVQIKMNNRKILAGIADSIGQADKIVDITVAIDKLDKIGLENVNAELSEKGLPADAIEKLQPIIKMSGSNYEKLDTIQNVLGDSEVGKKGCEECRFILDRVKGLGLKSELQLDLTLARGLNYYTGAIFEVKALDVEIGSIAMLNEMYKIGCLKSDIVAKISGGADIMNLNLKNSIGSRNVEFAKEFCRKEGFRIISEHVRGEHGRLILLADNFETFIKVTQKTETDSKILSNEKSLQIEISKAPVIKE